MWCIFNKFDDGQSPKKPVLILFSHLHLICVGGFFHLGSLIEILYAFPITVYLTCPTCLIFHDMIGIRKFGGQF